MGKMEDGSWDGRGKPYSCDDDGVGLALSPNPRMLFVLRYVCTDGNSAWLARSFIETVCNADGSAS